MRFDTWRELLGTVDEHPFGHGLGTVGAASSDGSGEVTTADNSFLKLLVEQGIPGAALFLAALFGGIVLLARRLVRVGGDRGAAGVASLGAFVGFLALSTTGEYVEQPGKAAAWALLGIAVGAALVPAPERGARA
jgi:O-antigen ligase